jgi:hypothetical protein
MNGAAARMRPIDKIPVDIITVMIDTQNDCSIAALAGYDRWFFWTTCSFYSKTLPEKLLKVCLKADKIT